MIFRDTILIRNDDGSRKEIPCTLFDYKTKVGTIKCGIHTTEQPWLGDKCDVSEVTTGCRMCALSCVPKKATIAMATTSMDNFIEEHGVRAVFARIKELNREG